MVNWKRLRAAAALLLVATICGCQSGSRLQPERLQDPDPLVRLAAVDELAEDSRDETLSLLEAATRDGEAEVALAAVTALGDRGDVRAVPVLIATLAHPDADIGFAAEEALLKIGPPATRRLTASLDPNQVQTATRIAEVLGRLGDPDAVPALIAAISPPFPEPVNVAAVAALGQLGDGRAAEPLVAALAQKRTIVPYTVTAALLGIGAPAVPPLIERLDDPDPDVAGMAAETLGRLKDPRAVTPLVARLADRENDAVRLTAAVALGEIGNPRAVGPLIAALSDEFAVVREKAAEALAAIGSAAVPDLANELSRSDTRLVVRVCDVLGDIGDDQAVEPLLTVLAQRLEKPVRLAAVDALGRIKSMEALPRLQELILGSDGSLREGALTAAGAIGEPAIPMLADLLENGDAGIQAAAARGLILVGKPSTAAVVDLLPRLNAAGRRQAAEVLRQAGPSMIEPVVPLLGHSDAAVRQIAFELLKSAGEEALPALRQVLASSKNGWSRRLAAQALGELSDFESADLLVRALMDREAAGHAAGALRQLGWQPESDRDKVHYFVAVGDRIGLQTLGPAATSVLMNDLTRSRGRYAPYAVAALLETQGEAVVSQLVEVLFSSGLRSLSKAYSASGQPQLEEAAAAWQAANP